jgi:hypothetical protein
MPVPVFDARNRLLIRSRLQDGHSVWEFQRFVNAWGLERFQDLRDLGAQFSPRNIGLLLKNSGFMLVYSHMFEGLGPSRDLPGKVRRNFENIAGLFKDGQVLIATTSRLLRFREVCRHVSTRMTTDGEKTRIDIEPRLVLFDGQTVELERANLDGLTFYCAEPERTEIWFGDKKVETALNPPDESGRASVSIPWPRLEFPGA